MSICDDDQVVLSTHEKKYNIKGYLDLAHMIEKVDLDLVILCTPSGLHAEQTETCIKGYQCYDGKTYGYTLE